LVARSERRAARQAEGVRGDARRTQGEEGAHAPPTDRPKHGATPFINDHLDRGYQEGMSDPALVAVSIGNGLVVWHTRDEWDAFMRGVDREATGAMKSKLDEFLRRERAR